MSIVRVGGNSSARQAGTLKEIGTYVGTFNPASGLPTTGTGRGGIILKGDYWKASGSGTIADILPFTSFAEGDLLFAIKNNANTVDDFFGNKGTGGGATSGNGTTVSGTAVNMGGSQNNDIVILPDQSLTRIFRIGDDAGFGSQDRRAQILLYGTININNSGAVSAMSFEANDELITNGISDVDKNSGQNTFSDRTITFTKRQSDTNHSFYRTDQNRVIFGRAEDIEDPALGNTIECNDIGIGFFGATPIEQPTLTESNVTETRTLDPTSATTEDVANVLGTLIQDLKSYGLFV